MLLRLRYRLIWAGEKGIVYRDHALSI